MRDALAGSRIRERRVMAGIKQADLARQIGISASYLNLIEHNRRRIAGKLLLDIASALQVEPSALTEGAEAALIAALREAALRSDIPEAEAARADQFAGRFPGWAEALAAANRRIDSLERTVETLTDRLAHDPELAASVHEVLSTAASIRATAAILADDPDITPEWRQRFHTNLDADSLRLAASSKSLVGFLDTETGEAASGLSIQEEVEAFFSDHDYRVEALLSQGEAAVSEALSSAPHLTSQSARRMAETVLARIAADQSALPTPALRAAMADHGPDPFAVAQACAVAPSCVMRRLAMIEPDLGLVVADRAGSLLFRKAIQGFQLPRHGAGCPIWPLFEALGRPGTLIHTQVEMVGRTADTFDCYAVADLAAPMQVNAAPLPEATMLIVPRPQDTPGTGAPFVQVGPACRICPRKSCAGRREPSILSEGF